MSLEVSGENLAYGADNCITFLGVDIAVFRVLEGVRIGGVDHTIRDHRC